MRCPRCHSENCMVINEVEESGSDYSASQGCCGYLLFGWVGLLCGLCGQGRTTRVKNFWICNSCGKKWRA